jgi:hypothetical protein
VEASHRDAKQVGGVCGCERALHQSPAVVLDLSHWCQAERAPLKGPLDQEGRTADDDAIVFLGGGPSDTHLKGEKQRLEAVLVRRHTLTCFSQE